MLHRLLFLLLGFSASFLQAEWLYVDEGPWAYDLSSGHWMYILPFHQLSLDYDWRGHGHAEVIFDPAETDFSDRWLYTGNLPYLYDFTAQTWTKLQGGPLRWACELIPDGQGNYRSVWLSAFDPLGKKMVPEELTIDSDLSLGHFIQAFSIHYVGFFIYIRPIEQDGETHLIARPSSSSTTRQPWADELGWNEETPAIYKKVSETQAILTLPDLGVKIHLEYNKYRSGSYSVYGPDDQLLFTPSTPTEIFTLGLTEELMTP